MIEGTKVNYSFLWVSDERSNNYHLLYEKILSNKTVTVSECKKDNLIVRWESKWETGDVQANIPFFHQYKTKGHLFESPCIIQNMSLKSSYNITETTTDETEDV